MKKDVKSEQKREKKKVEIGKIEIYQGNPKAQVKKRQGKSPTRRRQKQGSIKRSIKGKRSGKREREREREIKKQRKRKRKER